MSIPSLITEAMKIIPAEYEVAHAWLNDLLTTEHRMHDPVNAIRFFMLGLHACEVITLDEWDAFDSLITAKNPKLIH